MNIRTMQPAELDFAASLTALEGWRGETRQVFDGFFEHDPDGCFIAESDARKIGICVATPYQGFGFIGELIVVEEQRGRGIGRQLLERAIAYLRERRAAAIFLDGMLKAVPLYERIGFRKVCRSWRISGNIPGIAHPSVRPMRADDLGAVATLDRVAFGADRNFFLERRLALHPHLCLVLEGKNEVQGFIMGRRVGERLLAGPWVAAPSTPRPNALLESLASQAGQASLSIGVLGSNPAALAEAESYELAASPASPWRMALGEPALPGEPGLIYAIGSPAKG
ncbi:MAG: GNAT family N-acetyltransferase [Anaerolineales bacterium]|nr:GNAT family N-acetyltransferase [Anaerolineales bacterium]